MQTDYAVPNRLGAKNSVPQAPKAHSRLSTNHTQAWRFIDRILRPAVRTAIKFPAQMAELMIRALLQSCLAICKSTVQAAGGAAA
jgi:hypothetical protein